MRTSPFVSSNLLSFPQPHLRFLLSLSSCLSGLSGLDLQHAYGSLLKVKKTIVYEESEEDSEVDQQVDTVLSLLRSKPEEPQVWLELRNGSPLIHSLQSLAFYNVTAEILTKLKITSTEFIALKPNSEQRIEATTSLGEDELWSSANLYRQLLCWKSYFFLFTEGSGRCEDLERFVCVFKLSVHIDHPDKVSGRRWIQIQRNWKAKGPFVLTEHKSTSQWSYLVHRIKVDELAGCIITTFDKRGLLVTDLNENFILWSLPQVYNQCHHYLLIIIQHLTQ